MFLFTEDGRDDDVVGAFKRYRDYVESVRNTFPPSAYVLATSEWYFNPEDHRSPHDAWLETLHLTEPSSGERQEIRTLSLDIRLLGAYHDGFIELRYPRVFGYRLNLDTGERGHGDWRYDEFRVSARGHLVHEIEWRGGDRWLIEASDLQLTWVPRSKTLDELKEGIRKYIRKKHARR
jgi:hypothetical protein